MNSFKVKEFQNARSGHCEGAVFALRVCAPFLPYFKSSGNMVKQSSGKARLSCIGPFGCHPVIRWIKSLHMKQQSVYKPKVVNKWYM